jgi:hypothetical protein
MARLHARDGAPDINELERRAEEQLQNVGQHVANLRHSVHEELDMRSRVKDGVHTKPRAFYSAAAGAGALAGYVVARLIKA